MEARLGREGRELNGVRTKPGLRRRERQQLSVSRLSKKAGHPEAWGLEDATGGGRDE